MHGAPFDAGKTPTGLLQQSLPSAAEALSAAVAWIHAHPRSTPRAEPISICDPEHRERGLAAIPFVRPQASAASGIAVIDAVQVGLKDGFDAAVAREQVHLVDLRHTPEARAKLDAFLKRG